MDKLEPSVGICFYLREPKDIGSLKDLINNVKGKFPESMPFSDKIVTMKSNIVKPIESSIISTEDEISHSHTSFSILKNS